LSSAGVILSSQCETMNASRKDNAPTYATPKRRMNATLVAINKDEENKKGMTSFLHIDWAETGTAYVTLVVRDYPATGVTLEDLVPVIQTVREKSLAMIIKADLRGANIVNIELFKSIFKLVSEVIEYTRDDDLLRQIQFIGTGFVFRMLYGPISLAIPKYFRDMVVFI